MKKLVTLILISILVNFGSAYAQKPAVILSDKSGWHKIGKVTVDFTKEKDEISVLVADRFAKIKFKVEDAPINLISLEIYFESGDQQNVVVNSKIKASGESELIDLYGGERNLKKIVFVYKTLPNRKDKKAKVEVWGLKTNTNKK
ncbi:hypothetical protein OX284_010795 [Flavobacterium sp. SUN046]|uniref:hypothetical protein n=1 Tax=Flavobacterium sp. SUN046 TaxID=3002440 RepID=UPI002DB957EF|nr:hypothetical protein [Flavobacterium sp. SUN046]MEC4049917.1 hypothetical protein [Flavobacterium sp. SUN046]